MSEKEFADLLKSKDVLKSAVRPPANGLASNTPDTMIASWMAVHIIAWLRTVRGRQIPSVVKIEQLDADSAHIQFDIADKNGKGSISVYPYFAKVTRIGEEFLGLTIGHDNVKEWEKVGFRILGDDGGGFIETVPATRKQARGSFAQSY